MVEQDLAGWIDEDGGVVKAAAGAPTAARPRQELLARVASMSRSACGPGIGSASVRAEGSSPAEIQALRQYREPATLFRRAADASGPVQVRRRLAAFDENLRPCRRGRPSGSRRALRRRLDRLCRWDCLLGFPEEEQEHDQHRGRGRAGRSQMLAQSCSIPPDGASSLYAPRTCPASQVPTNAHAPQDERDQPLGRARIRSFASSST